LDVRFLSSLPYSTLHAASSEALRSGMKVFQERVTNGMSYLSTMSKNMALCSRLGFSASVLSQLQKTNAISTSRSPFSFWSMTAFSRLRDPGPLPVENQPSLSIALP